MSDRAARIAGLLRYKTNTRHPGTNQDNVTEEYILSDNLNEELYLQHKQQTEKSLKKLIAGLVVLFFIIVIGAFFV
jgi:hypothetical protein